jgi:hypothetical protein
MVARSAACHRSWQGEPQWLARALKQAHRDQVMRSVQQEIAEKPAKHVGEKPSRLMEFAVCSPEVVIYGPSLADIPTTTRMTTLAASTGVSTASGSTSTRMPPDGWQ